MVALRDKIPVEQIYHDVGVKVEKVEPKGPDKNHSFKRNIKRT